MKIFAFLILSCTLFSCTSQKSALHPVTADPVTIHPDYPPAMSEISFESEGSKVNGLMYIADGPGPHPTLILLHGYAGNERNLDVAQGLRRSGVNVMYFNYRGSWGSGGEFMVSNALADIQKAVSLLRTPEWANKFRVDPDNVALVGHSFGGFLGALATAADPSLPCYTFIAGVDLGALGLMMRNNEGVRPMAKQALGKDMNRSGGPIHGDVDTFLDEIIDQAGAYHLISKAPELATRPLLMIAAEFDKAVPKQTNHDPLMAALKDAGAKQLTEVVYADDHVFSASRIALAKQIVNWQKDACW